MERAANIINLRTVNIKQWLKGPNNVYIGRKREDIPASKWGNPHKVRRNCRNSRTKAITLYEQHLRRNKALTKAALQLKDKNLGCWCAPKRCHGEVLHKIAGNLPIYQTRKMENEMDTTETKSLDQQVSETLEALNTILEQMEQEDIDLQSPIPMYVATPLQSTVDTNQMYETLLESRSSNNSTMENSSCSKFSSRSSSKSPPAGNLHFLTNTERFEFEYNLKRWRSKQSKSFHPSPNLLHNTSFERKYLSAPTSPVKSTIRERKSSAADAYPLPRSFSYHPSPIADPALINVVNGPEGEETDATQKILAFFAEKIDHLFDNIRTVQHSISKITESLSINVDEKLQGYNSTLENLINYNTDYLEGKFDAYKAVMDKNLKAVQSENAELRDKLEAYILQDSEREERIKECFNPIDHPPNPCVTDLLLLKEDLEKKLHDLDVRLVESEQYFRGENLIISGIPNTVSQRDLQSKVIEILGTIGLVLIPDDIAACHRLYNPPRSNYPAKVIVRFVNRKIVNFCLEHREDLQNQAFRQLKLNLRFFESLCQKNEESLRICKWLSQEGHIHNHFIRNGFVKVAYEENGNPQKIIHPDILRKKFSNIPEGI